AQADQSLCDLSADPLPRRQGAAVHRFPGRTFRAPAPLVMFCPDQTSCFAARRLSLRAGKLSADAVTMDSLPFPSPLRGGVRGGGLGGLKNSSISRINE